MKLQSGPRLILLSCDQQEADGRNSRFVELVALLCMQRLRIRNVGTSFRSAPKGPDLGLKAPEKAPTRVLSRPGAYLHLECQKWILVWCQPSKLEVLDGDRSCGNGAHGRSNLKA